MLISAIPIVPQTVGANRIVRGVRIENVCGDPTLSESGDQELNMRITRTAIRALQTEVETPTIFDPLDTKIPEASSVS